MDRSQPLRPSLRRREAGQVSHGLNLVLRLKRPAEMPLLLARIGQAQCKINAGLPALPGLPGVKVPDWPLYAAYPEQTVLDITGPRSDLPVPKADRWATEVDRDDVQG